MPQEKSGLKCFTTEPRHPRKRGCWRSAENARDFMHSLFLKGLKTSSYDTLVWEYVRFFGTNDKRTIERYLGRPKKTVRYSAMNVVRIDRQRGSLAQFEYHTQRKLDSREGLLKSLGYVTDLKNGYFKLNHELLPYYAEQATLQEVSPSPPHQEDDLEECSSGVHTESVCVSSIGVGGSVKGSVDVKVKTTIDDVREEEEDIDSTHTCKIGKSREFSGDEKRVLKAYEEAVGRR